VAAFFLVQQKGRVAPVQDREDLEKSSTDREELRTAFNAFETDHSGELNKEEFRAVMVMTKEGEENSALTDVHVEFEIVYSEVDKDGRSGSISFDEYYAWSTSY
jgi:Ca2+-binding EF-hand superfamily protein